MAQRAIIDRNDGLTQFDEIVEKLITPGIGSGSVTWVPDADTRCSTLKVTRNGTYTAASAGKFGYDYVTVSVPGSSVVGRDPDTGEEVAVGVDPETGDITETVIPTSIRVVTPPNKVVYNNGETINYTGIVVHKYSARGTDLGVVPYGELVFPVSKANAVDGKEWTDGAGINAMMLFYTPNSWYTTNQQGTIIGSGTVYVDGRILGEYRGDSITLGSSIEPATVLITRYNNKNYAAGATGRAEVNAFAKNPTESHPLTYGWYIKAGTSSRTGDQAFEQITWSDVITDLPISTVDPTGASISGLKAIQSLPVQWARSPDGAILETSFDITVNGGAA